MKDRSHCRADEELPLPIIIHPSGVRVGSLGQDSKQRWPDLPLPVLGPDHLWGHKGVPKPDETYNVSRWDMPETTSWLPFFLMTNQRWWHRCWHCAKVILLYFSGNLISFSRWQGIIFNLNLITLSKAPSRECKASKLQAEELSWLRFSLKFKTKYLHWTNHSQLCQKLFKLQTRNLHEEAESSFSLPASLKMLHLIDI